MYKKIILVWDSDIVEHKHKIDSCSWQMIFYKDKKQLKKKQKKYSNLQFLNKYNIMKINFDIIKEDNNKYYPTSKLSKITYKTNFSPQKFKTKQNSIAEQLTTKIYPKQSIQTSYQQSQLLSMETTNRFPIQANFTTSLQSHENKISNLSPSSKYYFETYDKSKNYKQAKSYKRTMQIDQIGKQGVFIHPSIQKKVQSKESQKQLVKRLSQIPVKKLKCQKVVNQEDQKKYQNQHACLIQKFQPAINKDFKYADIKDKRYNGVLYGLTMNRSVEILKKQQYSFQQKEEKKNIKDQNKVTIHKKLYTQHWHRKFRMLSKSLEQHQKQKVKQKKYKNPKYLKNYVNFYERLPNEVTKKHTKQNYYDMAYEKGFIVNQNQKNLFKPHTSQSQRTHKLKSKIVPNNSSYLQRLQKNNSNFSKSTYFYQNKASKKFVNIQDTQTSRQSLQGSIDIQRSQEIHKENEQLFVSRICQIFGTDNKIAQISPSNISKLTQEQFDLLFPLFTQIQELSMSCSSMRRLSGASGEEYTQLSASKFKEMLLYYLQNLQIDEKIQLRHYLVKYNKPRFFKKWNNSKYELQKEQNAQSNQQQKAQPYTQRAESNRVKQSHIRHTNAMSKSYYQKIKNFV